MRRIRHPSAILTLALAVAITANAYAQTPADSAEIVFRIIRSRIAANLLRYDAAIADMDTAIMLAPDNPLLYVERAQRIILLYEWDRALADYDRAVKLDPAYAAAYYYRGILYTSVPEGIDARRAALEDFQHYLELAPDGSHAADAARYAAELATQLSALTAPGK